MTAGDNSHALPQAEAVADEDGSPPVWPYSERGSASRRTVSQVRIRTDELR
jgi:hypothetical protein